MSDQCCGNCANFIRSTFKPSQGCGLIPTVPFWATDGVHFSSSKVGPEEGTDCETWEQDYRDQPE